MGDIESKHIVFLCSQLDTPGGIERAVINTANLFFQRGYKVSILIFDKQNVSFYKIHQQVIIRCIPLNFGITSEGNVFSRKLLFFLHVRSLRNILKQMQPDIVIGTEYVFTIVSRIAINVKNIRVLGWEHQHYNHLHKSWFWKFLQKLYYPKLDFLVCLNITESEYYRKIRCNTIVIPNFILRNDVVLEKSKQLLTIGWLSFVKGVDHIPTIAEKVFKLFPEWRWIVIGQGLEYENLKSELVNRSLERNVIIKNPCTNKIEELYSGTDLYVLISRFECFPMVLLEAMSFGIPCIAFDCPTGPRHIITNSIDGILVKDQNLNDMIEAIISLINNVEQRNSLGRNALNNIKRFDQEKVYKEWEKVIV